MYPLSSLKNLQNFLYIYIYISIKQMNDDDNSGDG